MTDVRKFVFKDARYLIVEKLIHETARRDLCALRELSRKYSRGDRGLQLNGNNSLILRPIWQNFLVSVSVADYGKVNEYHTEKISFSLLKHGL